MVPRLKKRGVRVETEIEYRVGAYFVLAANIMHVDWVKLMSYSREAKKIRQQKWIEAQGRRDKLREGTAEEDADEEAPKSKFSSQFVQIGSFIQRARAITAFEVIANCLAWLDYLPRIISVPFCFITYHCFLKATVNVFILSTAADSEYLET